MILSWDLETYVARRSEFAPRIVCGGWSHDGRAPEIGLRDRALAELANAVTHPDVVERIINQYIAYDVACALEEWSKAQGERVRGVYGSVHWLVRATWEALRAGKFVGIDICQQLLDVARGEGLIESREKQGYSLTNIMRWNNLPAEDKDDHAWRMFFRQLDGVPPEQWPEAPRTYLEGDAINPHLVLRAQLAENQKWIDVCGYPVLHQAPEQTWTQVNLHLVAAHGVRANPARTKELDATVTAEIQSYVRPLRHAGHWVQDESGKRTWIDDCGQQDLNPEEAKKGARGCAGCLRPFGEDDVFAAPAPLLGWKREDGAWRYKAETKAAAERMRRVCAAKGLTVPMTEPSSRHPQGQVRLDEDACVLSEDPVLRLYADYSGARHLRARVNDLLEGATTGWPLHTEFTSVRATGRTSSRKPREPHAGTQQQNWPRIEGARETLEPRDIWDPITQRWVEGCFLWGDFEAAEMHTLAQSCKDVVGYSHLGELLNHGVDPHAFFAGVARVGLRGSPKDIADAILAREDSKDMRGWAKPYNFGKPGGMGDEKFILFSRKQYGVDFTREEAAHYGRLWFATLPEVKALHQHVKRLLGRHQTCVVRLPRGGFVGGGKRFTAACNFYFQAPCAGGAKAALNHVMFECYADPDSPLFGFRVWNLVHDELCLEGPLARVHEAGERLREIMEREFNRFTPDYPTAVEVIAGKNWSKGAKPIKRDGRLVPGVWLPKAQRQNPKKAWVPYEVLKEAA